MRRWIVLALLLLGCGGSKSGSEDAPPPTIQVDRPTVQVRLLEPVPQLDLTTFESQHGVSVQIVTDALDQPERPHGDTLREMEWIDVARAAHSQWIQSVDASALIEVAPAFAQPTFADQAWGIPWRTDLHLLVADRATLQGKRPGDWRALAVALRGKDWGVDPSSSSVGTLMAMIPGGAGTLRFNGEIQLGTEPVVEALSYLGQLAGAPQPAQAKSWAGAVLLTDVAGAATQQAQRDVMLVPIPDSSGGSTRVTAWPRVLAIPRGGPHRDLAVALAQAMARSVPSADLLPCRQDASSGDAELDRALASAVPPPLMLEGRRVVELLEHAVEQSLSRRRTPTEALGDAQNSLLTHPRR